MPIRDGWLSDDYGSNGMEVWKITAFIGLVGLAIAYSIVCWYLWQKQARFIFFPTPEITRTPDDLNLDYEEVWVESVEPGAKLHGWWIPNSATDRVLLYLHGNADNIGANAYHAGRFYHLGFSVFIFDYRGYGQSGGEFPTEKTVYEDSDRIWNYLTQERGIAPEKISVYGHSLGGAIGIELASKQPKINGLAIEGSFTSIINMTYYRHPILGLFPIHLLLQNRFDSIDKVPHLQMPLFFIHGTADKAVPSFMSQELFAAANGEKKLWLFPDGEHSTVAPLAGEEYFDNLREFWQLPVFPIPSYYRKPSD
ncbi:alpha/beta hydrolase [Roseofilum casamattae]|uniref:Alpha/beta fold hydrolase n=1 Tax=Roseofilum casamattae BLCC-M143 TaxID=3022442 RepID=A0ABT7C067_9CYAN|nr:alpha/beta fold hydrolase [Roseofilum casamattae]MDJ1184845.1 alpha/beta fold hydrolase [Roseofilum casamattae BLCC-M143]